MDVTSGLTAQWTRANLQEGTKERVTHAAQGQEGTTEKATQGFTQRTRVRRLQGQRLGIAKYGNIKEGAELVVSLVVKEPQLWGHTDLGSSSGFAIY